MSEIMFEQAPSITLEQTAKGYRTTLKAIMRKDESDDAFILRAVTLQAKLNAELEIKGYKVAPFDAPKAKVEVPTAPA